MRSRTLIALVPVFLLGGCARDAVGPSSPIVPAQMTPGPALDASAAREAVIEFVDAYRASAREGIEPLMGLVAGRDLTSWVQWLGVQHREFEGTIKATADVRDVEFVAALATTRASGASVGLSASVAFTFDPPADDPIHLVRVLDGPVTLVRTAPATYRILDLLRNGVPMSDSIEPFRHQERTRGDLTVRLDSLFMFPPKWQFNVLVQNRGDHEVVLDPEGAALFVEHGDSFDRIDGVITRSLGRVPAGATTDGLMVFPAQRAAEGRVLSLLYGKGRNALRFAFPLDDLVTVVPPPSPTDPGAVETVPG